MQSNQTKPTLLTIKEDLAKTSNYDGSFVRCNVILKEIETITGCRTVAYFSAFNASVGGVMDSDASIIEDLIRCKNDKKPLLLILNSPGGQAVAAEKILQVCRAYAKENKTEFYALISKSAKSAATIIALGADKILMSQTAELGPIDPQIIHTQLMEKGKKVTKEVDQNGKETVVEEKIFQQMPNVVPAFRIIKAVEGLISRLGAFGWSKKDSVNHFLKQYNYDMYTMAKNEFQLSEDILNKIIKKKTSISAELNDGFKKDCEIFFNPELTLSHNRPITFEDLEESQLVKTGFVVRYEDFFKEKEVDDVNVKKLDSLLWEYHTRTNTCLEDKGNQLSKMIESSSNRVALTQQGDFAIS